MPASIDSLVKLYDLKPHPEGGFFKETYRSPFKILKTDNSHFTDARNISTAIFFLLPAGTKSHLHRIKSDEIWHFYLGGPMKLVQIFEDGREIQTLLGQDIHQGQILQHCVPAGCWFGGFPLPSSDYSFVGCTVAPGFDFRDFEMASKKDLKTRFPQLHMTIDLLCD